MADKADKITIDSIEVNQPIGKFYIGRINFKDLLSITFSDIRRIEERDIEKYIGIQRPLSPKRVDDLKQYINLVDASFPTSIILSIDSDNVSYDPDNKKLTIIKRPDIAKILDGQHRIAGFEDNSMAAEKFQLNVTIFIDMEIEDQAILFATINKTQTKVNQSLVIDLFEYAKSRSPQKTAHNITRVLNFKKGSPFYGKIKLLGTALDKEKETITQATMAQNIMKYITKNPMNDRDIYKRGGKPKSIVGDETIKLIFRNLFIDEKDEIITMIIWNYFMAIQNKWEDAWTKVQENSILNRSTGFIALMKLLKDIYVSFKKPDKVISITEFQNIFNKIDLKDGDFNREAYIPGSSGQAKLYNDLLAKSGISL
ncbi:MAG: DGQHR domain-containing protein [Candidatus Saganbacteria bacterium]|nr:DGQHR domain-containing protein [Candidatus Saganbacteria bacterium]